MCIRDSSIYRVDAISGDPVIVVVVQDSAAKGRIKVCKEGEVLSGYENGQFVYEMKRLPGVVFEVVAAEDIPTADRQKDDEGNAYLEYAAGTLVATLTTDENGEAYTDDLPLGVYNIIERQTLNGFVLDDSVHTVNLAYANQETEVVVEAITIANERQKVSLTVAKKAEGKETLLALSLIHICIARSSPNEPPQPGIDAFNEAGQPIGYCGKRKDDEADYNQRAALPPVRHG